jgi:hypothetical protein
LRWLCCNASTEAVTHPTFYRALPKARRSHRRAFCIFNPPASWRPTAAKLRAEAPYRFNPVEETAKRLSDPCREKRPRCRAHRSSASSRCPTCRPTRTRLVGGSMATTAGIRDRIMDALAVGHDAAVQMIDTSIVRVHQHRACIAGQYPPRLLGRLLMLVRVLRDRPRLGRGQGVPVFVVGVGVAPKIPFWPKSPMMRLLGFERLRERQCY